MKTALTIAGSDPSGGAGIQADLKTFHAHGVFGMSVITAVTVQNTQKVYSVQEIDPQMVYDQILYLFED
ncbi:MAG: bifunctional hydroxymethylpyrimidine kinase/phosphomethylpyrimidine kinase, partial [Desulfobacteraceae bacterium]